MDGVQPFRIDISLIFITQDQTENTAFRIKVDTDKKKCYTFELKKRGGGKYKDCNDKRAES